MKAFRVENEISDNKFSVASELKNKMFRKLIELYWTSKAKRPNVHFSFA